MTRRCFFSLAMVWYLLVMGLSMPVSAETFYVTPHTFEGQINKLQENDHVVLRPGAYLLTRALTLFQHGITLAAERTGSVTLDFSLVDEGAQGILIRGNGVTISGLKLLNPPGDGIVARGVERFSVNNVSVTWWPSVRPPGGYGIYPVMSRDVSVTNSYVSGANEAGIYVGQTQFANVSDNHTVSNTVGIDIENSSFVTVNNNRVRNNAIGIAITGRPYLRVKNPKRIRIFDNEIGSNNLSNFAPSGSFAESLGYGVGILGVAVKELSISGNRFSGHALADIYLADFSSLSRPYRGDQNYRAYLSHARLGENSHHPTGAAVESATGEYMNNIWQRKMIEIGWPSKGKFVSKNRLCLQGTAPEVYRQAVQNQGLHLKKCIN